MPEVFSEKAVGACPCPYCKPGQPRAEVRKNRKGKLFLYCPKGPDRTRGHGIQHLNTEEGQEWILNNAEMFGPEGQPAASPKETTEPAAAKEKPPTPVKPAESAPAPTPAPKKSVWDL